MYIVVAETDFGPEIHWSGEDFEYAKKSLKEFRKAFPFATFALYREVEDETIFGE